MHELMLGNPTSSAVTGSEPERAIVIGEGLHRR